MYNSAVPFQSTALFLLNHAKLFINYCVLQISLYLCRVI